MIGVITWALIYGIGYRDSMVIDGFASEELCKAAIVQLVTTAKEHGHNPDSDNFLCAGLRRK